MIDQFPDNDNTQRRIRQERVHIHTNLGIFSAGSAQKPPHPKAERLQALAEEIVQMYAEQYTCEIPFFKVSYIKRKTATTLGRYDPDTATITLYDHSGNEHEQTNTVIHELAHHLQHQVEVVECGKILARPGRKHGATFELHYHRLIHLAQEKGYYDEPYMEDPGLRSLIEELRVMNRCDGDSALRTGELLSKARDRCREVKASFELFIRDGCGFHRSLAYDYIRAWELKLPADLGVARMRFVLRVPEHLRENAIQDIHDGAPLALLRFRYRPDLGKEPSEGGIEWDPAEELQRLKASERYHLEKYRSAKKRRTQLETYWSLTPTGQPMSTNSTSGGCKTNDLQPGLRQHRTRRQCVQIHTNFGSMPTSNARREKCSSHSFHQKDTRNTTPRLKLPLVFDPFSNTWQPYEEIDHA